MAKERVVPVDETDLKGRRGCPKGGWPKKKGGLPKKKRGCPKGGWPKKADLGEVRNIPL